jgi:hypothetical protein
MTSWTTLPALTHTTITIWAIYGSLDFFRHLPALSLLLRMRSISHVNLFTEKRHALPRSDWLDEEDLHDLMGTLPTGHLWVSSTMIQDHTRKDNTEAHWSRYNDMSQNIYFVSSHASHQYAPRSRNRTKPIQSKYKRCVTWTSTACLGGSTTSKLW